MATFIYFGVNFYVGRNAKNNWELLDKANDNDIWVHLDNLPSCYVIIDSNSSSPINKTHIKYAGQLCLTYSKIPNDVKGVHFIFTECKNVKKGKSTGEAILLTTPERRFQKLSF